MKIAVTGASGFIGQNLCRYLLGVGHEVIPVLRSADRAPDLGRLGMTTRVADIRDSPSLDADFKSVDAVIHLAALFNRPDASWDDYRQVNVEGAENVAEAALRGGASRLVHCSTVGVAVGSGKPPFSEKTPYSPPAWDKYETTKAQGEQVALEFHRKQGLPVVVIRPAQVYGPGDRSKAKFYRMVKRGIMVSPGRTLKCYLCDHRRRDYYHGCYSDRCNCGYRPDGLQQHECRPNGECGGHEWYWPVASHNWPFMD